MINIIFKIKYSVFIFRICVLSNMLCVSLSLKMLMICCGYTPQSCISDINECMSSPCSGASCTNTIGSYECACPQGMQYDSNMGGCLGNTFAESY